MERSLGLQEVLPGVITAGALRIEELTPHKNRGVEITYIRRGHLEWIVDGVSESVQQGMVFFTLPWQAHGSARRAEPKNEVCHMLLSVGGDLSGNGGALDFDSSLGLTRKEEKAVLTAFTSAVVHAWPASAALGWLMMHLTTTSFGASLLDRGAVAAMTRAVLLELGRIVSGEGREEAEELDSEARVRGWLGTLAESCEEAWSVDEMASACGLKRSRFTSITRQVTGCSPLQVLKQLRLGRARYLLAESETPITRIAYACGFSSSQQFAREFKEVHNLTPRAYRRSPCRTEGGPSIDWARIGWRDLETEQQRLARFKH